MDNRPFAAVEEAAQLLLMEAASKVSLVAEKHSGPVQLNDGDSQKVFSCFKDKLKLSVTEFIRDLEALYTRAQQDGTKLEQLLVVKDSQSQLPTQQQKMPPTLVGAVLGDCGILRKMTRAQPGHPEKGLSILDAAKLGNPYLVQQCLVKYKRGLNKARDVRRKTALMLAVESGSLETVRVLITHGATVNDCVPNNAPIDRGATALSLAYSRRDLPIMQVLVENGASSTVETRGTAPLVLCEYERGASLDSPHFKLLMDANHEVDKILVGSGSSLLHMASGVGDVKMIETLISKSAELNSPRADKRSKDMRSRCETNVPALFIAILNGHVRVAETLVKAGVDLSYVSSVHGNALETAMHAGQQSIVRLLISITKQGVKELNPFKNLPKNDSRFSAIDGLFSGPYAVAIHNNDVEMLSILLESNFQFDEIRQCRTAVEKERSASQGSSSAASDSGRFHSWGVPNKFRCLSAPLFVAARSGEIACLQKLLSSKLYSATGAVDEGAGKVYFPHQLQPLFATGDTALHAAALAGNSACVELLLQHEARVDVPNSLGQTALIKMAMAICEPGISFYGSKKKKTGYLYSPLVPKTKTQRQALSKEFGVIAKMLCRFGADINARDASGKSALMHVAAWGRNQQAHFQRSYCSAVPFVQALLSFLPEADEVSRACRYAASTEVRSLLEKHMQCPPKNIASASVEGQPASGQPWSALAMLKQNRKRPSKKISGSDLEKEKNNCKQPPAKRKRQACEKTIRKTRVVPVSHIRFNQVSSSDDDNASERTLLKKGKGKAKAASNDDSAPVPHPNHAEVGDSADMQESDSEEWRVRFACERRQLLEMGLLPPPPLLLPPSAPCCEGCEEDMGLQSLLERHCGSGGSNRGGLDAVVAELLKKNRR